MVPSSPSIGSGPNSRPDTPPAYPSHFRHEPYSASGYIFCEAPPVAVA
jgi:hypothetical protein